MVQPVLLWSPSLRGVVAEPLTEFPATELAGDLLETLIHYGARGNPGLAIAAPQVGIFKQIFVINFREDKIDHRYVMCNPVLTPVGAPHVVIEEGCLSLPGLHADVKRPEGIAVQYLDEAGAAQSLEAHGMLARVIQHEQSHLRGRFFIDELSSLKRGILINRHLKNCRRLQAAGAARIDRGVFAR